MTKEQRKIKELTAQVEDLTKKLKDVNYWKDYYSSENSKLREENNQVHSTLTIMGIPRDDLSIASRLTLLMAKIGLNSVIKLQAKTEENQI